MRRCAVRLVGMRAAIVWALAAFVVGAGAAPCAAQPERVDGSALERWVSVLVDGDPFASAEAERALMRAGAPARERLERRLLVTHSRRGRRRVARLLGRMGDRRATGALKALLARRKDDERARLEAAVALLRLRDTAGIPVLIELMDSDDRSVRLGAQLWFGRFTHRDFGYRFDGGGGERKRALRKIRAWWKSVREGFVLPGRWG